MTVDIGLSELPQAKPQEKPPKNTFEKAKTHLTSAKDTLRSWAGRKDSAPVKAETSKLMEEALAEEIPFTEVEDAARFLTARSLLDKSLNVAKHAGDTALGILPMVATGTAAYALQQIAGGSFSSEMGELIAAAATGGMAAIDGRNLGKSLREVSPKSVTRYAGIALLLAHSMHLAGNPMPNILSSFGDDAGIVMLRFLPQLGILPGGIK